MSNPKLLLAIILIQQGWFASLWLLAARMRMARRPALHWAAATGLVTGGMCLYLLRGQLSDWLTITLANVLMVVAFVTLRRGVQVFARVRPNDPGHALVICGGVVALVAGQLAGLGLAPAVLVPSFVIAWTQIQSAREVGGLTAEFGRQAAWWCAAPMAVIGLVFLLRGLMAAASDSPADLTVTSGDGRNTGMMVATMMFGLVINTTLIAMTMVRLVRRLQFQSEHDTLTGLYNRGAMESLVGAEAQRARRFGGGYALLSLDVDHFKRINDRWGHPAGDEVLVRVARTLKQAARAVDRVGRMGGEEFLILLPEVDQAGAEAAARRLLADVRALTWPELGDDVQVTVSVGLVAVGRADEPVASLMRRLDQALYRAKTQGRDRAETATTVAGALPEPA